MSDVDVKIMERFGTYDTIECCCITKSIMTDLYIDEYERTLESYKNMIEKQQIMVHTLRSIGSNDLLSVLYDDIKLYTTRKDSVERLIELYKKKKEYEVKLMMCSDLDQILFKGCISKLENMIVAQKLKGY